MKTLTDKEVDAISWHLLNLSQDIRFLIAFRLKKRKYLVESLKQMHDELVDLGMILIPNELTGQKYYGK